MSSERPTSRAVSRTVLLLDDDRGFCDLAAVSLRAEGRRILTAHSGAEGLRICRSDHVDVVVLDETLPDVEGHALCPAIIEANDRCKIIFATAQVSVETAVEAIRGGAYDFLTKPFAPEELTLAVDRALRTIALEGAAALAHHERGKTREGARLIGAEGGLRQVALLAASAAESDAPVLLTGETGSGKNVVSKVIHYSSRRSDQHYVTVNCAALPEHLIESELFGHEKGAFTGAASRRRGLFEMAQGGTLFLDEVGDMPMHLQAKLLGVLEERELRRIGGQTTVPVDVRVIAATGTDLEEALGRTFRRDLYYRLSVLRIRMPPLREHPEDIPALCEHFLAEMGGSFGLTIPLEEIACLQAYPWPGNVRELRNVLERATILQHGSVIRPSELLEGSPPRPAAPLPPLHDGEDERIISLADMERRHIERALGALGGNLTHTAEALGISLSTLKRRLKSYGLR